MHVTHWFLEKLNANKICDREAPPEKGKSRCPVSIPILIGDLGSGNETETGNGVDKGS